MLCAAGLLVAMMLTIFIRFGVRQLIVKRAHMDNIITRTIFYDNEALRRIEIKGKNSVPDIQNTKIDWERMYPFPDNRHVKKINLVSVEKFNNKTERIKKKIDDWTNKNLVGYLALREVASNYEVRINWNLIKTMPLGDGAWSFVSAKADINEGCESIVDLARFVESNGAHFLYVQAPNKIDPYGDTYKRQS